MFQLVHTGAGAVSFRNSHNTTYDTFGSLEEAWETAEENADDLRDLGFTVVALEDSAGFRASAINDEGYLEVFWLFVEEVAA